MKQRPLFETAPGIVGGDLVQRARRFCDTSPHRSLPYSRRNWGGPLHSLCTYQGKLKPAIAHFLVSWFTQPGARVLDPLAGVGTIPLEARRQGRIGIANDLSPLGSCVSRAKLEPLSTASINKVLEQLEHAIQIGPKLAELAAHHHIEFGLNGTIREYFHPDTMREILIARDFFRGESHRFEPAALDLVKASVLHILHGNRPYALSRRSHPVTPFAPSGPFESKSLVGLLTARLRRLLPDLLELQETSPAGMSIEGDFRTIDIDPVDCVITSPPFSRSLRFWSMNWMRLWFVGWEPEDFQARPAQYLETQQRETFAPYGEFAAQMAALLPIGGTLILHLGETATENMVERVLPEITDNFDVLFAERESVLDTETHGLTDKGATTAHWYVFAIKRPQPRDSRSQTEPPRGPLPAPS